MHSPGSENGLERVRARPWVAGMKNGNKRLELGLDILAGPKIRHGKPTFKGTRIMVWQVLDDVAEGRA